MRGLPNSTRNRDTNGSYITSIALKYNPAGGDSPEFPAAPLPVDPLPPHEGTASYDEVHPYQSRVGSLGWAAMISRPDMCFATGPPARFNPKPGQGHQTVRVNAGKSSVGSNTLRTRFTARDEDNVLSTAGDAADGDDPETGKSSRGHITFLSGGPTAWKSGRQATITASSTGTELLASAYDDASSRGARHPAPPAQAAWRLRSGTNDGSL